MINDKVSNLTKDAIEAERKEIESIIAKWTEQKNQAEENLEYWQRHLDAMISTQARYLF